MRRGTKRIARVDLEEDSMVGLMGLSSTLRVKSNVGRAASYRRPTFWFPPRTKKPIPHPNRERLIDER